MRLSLPGAERIIPAATDAIAVALLALNAGPATTSALTQTILENAQGVEALKSASSLPTVLLLLTRRGVLHECLIDHEGALVAELRHKGRIQVPDASKEGTAGDEEPSELDPRTVMRREVRGQGGHSVKGWVADVGLARASLWVSEALPATNPQAWPKEVLEFAERAGILSSTEVTDNWPWWDAVDLLFHERTREASSQGAYGGTRPHEGSGPRAAWKEARVLERVKLPVPRSLPAITLETAMAQRHSTRTFDGAITIDELSDLLGHTVRARRVFRDDKGTEVLDKSVPAGGSIHEGETWVAVHSSAVKEGTLSAGLWHYDCLTHTLEQIAGAQGADALLANTAAMSVGDAPPMTVLQTARFARLMWKYESVAYGLILKHTGVIHEAMQLVATSLGLGTCVLGGGATSLFSEVTGIDPHVEGVVGEMTLGRVSTAKIAKDSDDEGDAS